MEYLCVSEAARRMGVRPRDISDMFYRRQLRDDLCPIVAGRRLIPESYLDTIEVVLRRTGRRGLQASRSVSIQSVPACRDRDETTLPTPSW
jgi:hypothetical protein